MPNKTTCHFYVRSNGTSMIRVAQGAENAKVLPTQWKKPLIKLTV